MSNETVEVFVVWSRNVKIATANIVDSLVVHQEGAIGMLDSAVSRENRVVWFNDGRRDLRRRVDGELQLALLAVVDRQSLEEKSTKTGARATAEGVEDQEPLQGCAIVFKYVSQLSSVLWLVVLPATRRILSKTSSTSSLPTV